MSATRDHPTFTYELEYGWFTVPRDGGAEHHRTAWVEADSIGQVVSLFVKLLPDKELLSVRRLGATLWTQS